MPTCLPERPSFTTDSERAVWEALRRQLDPGDLLPANVRVTDRSKDHEADLVVVSPGAGVTVVEVKGRPGPPRRGSVMAAPARQRGGDRPGRAGTRSKYALRSYVEADPRLRREAPSRVRWAHLLVLPHVALDDGFALPDCPRWAVADRTQLDDLADRARRVAVDLDTGNRTAGAADVALIAEILRGRGLPQADVVALARQREDVARRLTEEQAVVLGATRLLRRVEVRGGAGSGKTWLAVEQARRLSAAGERVALLCYSRGLAAHLRRHVDGLKRQHRPTTSGSSTASGTTGAPSQGATTTATTGSAGCPRRCATWRGRYRRASASTPSSSTRRRTSRTPGGPRSPRLRDEDTGGVYAFSDEGQRVFARYGRPPVPLVPLVLDHNMRNTRQIADAFNPLAPMRMRLLGGDGPAVRFHECAADDALSAGDHAVDVLLEEGWAPGDVALLTTGSRHPEQAVRQERGQDAYWDSFWDDDSVFYGHVLGFKGLERRPVVLVLNEAEPRERSRERLYVGLSRARDQLVLCGDPAFVAEVGGVDVLRRLRGTT